MLNKDQTHPPKEVSPMKKIALANVLLSNLEFKASIIWPVNDGMSISPEIIDQDNGQSLSEMAHTL